MSKKPTVLMILDGYGLNDRHEGNAIYEAKTPVMDKLMAEYPFVKGNASGLAVGLPDGQMGNSEVGHMNMGAGRIVYQELTRITKEINDGDFFKNEALLAAMKNAKENDSAIHFMGLLSDGGVHSHNTHLYALLEMAKREGLKKVYVHCFLDGRDTPPASGKEFIEQLEAGKHHLGQRPVIFDILRSEGIQSIHTSHCNLTRGKTFNGTLIELTALQTVLIIIPVIVESIISVFCIDRRNYIHYTIGRSHPHIFIIIFYDTGNKYPRIVPRKRNYL